MPPFYFRIFERKGDGRVLRAPQQALYGGQKVRTTYTREWKNSVLYSVLSAQHGSAAPS